MTNRNDNNHADLGLLWIPVLMIGIAFTFYMMPKTLRWFTLGIYTACISVFVAMTSVQSPDAYNTTWTNAGTRIDTAAASTDTMFSNFQWYGWVGLGLFVYLAILFPKIAHHVNWHTYQNRPGIFGKTIETERFNWLPPFGTVHEHGCNAPVYVNNQAYQQAAREATYAPEHRTHAPEASSAPVRLPVGPSSPVPPASSPRTVQRVYDYDGWQIRDYRGFDPEADE